MKFIKIGSYLSELWRCLTFRHSILAPEELDSSQGNNFRKILKGWRKLQVKMMKVEVEEYLSHFSCIHETTPHEKVVIPSSSKLFFSFTQTLTQLNWMELDVLNDVVIPIRDQKRYTFFHIFIPFECSPTQNDDEEFRNKCDPLRRMQIKIK